LSEHRDIFLDARPPESEAHRQFELRRACMAKLGRRLFHLPLLRTLKPAARRIFQVSEPAGSISHHHQPNCDTSDRCDGLRVISANLWHDYPRRRRLLERLESFACLVEEQQADILLLQEVSRTSDMWVDRWLSERLCMAYFYARANGHAAAIGFEEGLAVFSRFPIHTPTLQELGHKPNPFVRRLALGANVETPCGKLMAFSVHLGLPRRHNARQLNHLTEWVSRVAGGGSALVGGDFNAHETSPQILSAQAGWLDTFRIHHPAMDGMTHTLRWPWGTPLLRSRLDYIFLHPGETRWQVLEARHIENDHLPHSDHKAVLIHLMPAQAGYSEK
jgi:endonuclease/exonuclease/phosphatase family metal-dependent hydrolase